MNAAEMLRRAQAALAGDRLEEAGQLAMEAVVAARGDGNQSAEAGALVVLGQALLRRDEPGPAADYFEAALVLLSARGAPEDAAVVRQALTLARERAAARDPSITLSAATDALASGAAEEALSLIRAALPVFGKNVEALSMARAVEARALQRMGHDEEALKVLGEALAAAEEAGLTDHVNGLRNLSRRLRQTVGLKRVASVSVEELTRTTPDPAKLSALLMQKALGAVAARDQEEARRLTEKGRAAAEASGMPIPRLQALVNAAQIYGAMGDGELARQMLTEARPLAEEHSPAVVGAIDEIARGLKGPSAGSAGQPV